MSLPNLILFLSLFLTGNLQATIAKLFVDEIESVDRAIAASEKRLAAQRQIRIFLLELRQQEDNLLKATDPKEVASRMVTLADKILAMIKQEHLESTFSSAYIEELHFYSSFARKMNLTTKENPPRSP